MTPQGSPVPLYIFDLDGTLALIEHRRPLVEAPICAMCDGDGSVVNGQKLALYKNVDVGHYHATQCPDCKGKGRGLPRGEKFKPQWDAFFEACDQDVPNWQVIGVLLQLYQIGADIQIWSGRSDAVRAKTIVWLYSALKLQPYVIDKMLHKMRAADDFTPDHQMKRAWLNAMPPADRARLGGVFDDRDSVVKMWRSEGLTCFQVAPGNF